MLSGQPASLVTDSQTVTNRVNQTMSNVREMAGHSADKQQHQQ